VIAHIHRGVNGEQEEAHPQLVGTFQKLGIGALTKILEDLKEENPEGVRIQVVNYFGKVAMNAKNQNGFLDACDILGAFSAPYNTSEGFGPLMLSIANARVFE